MSILPNPDGGHFRYGVTVYEVGEDGYCIVAFGHHDPRRFFAACNHLARQSWGLHNLADEAEATWQQMKSEISHTEAWFDGRPGNADWEWEIHWARPDGRTDQPVPITMWQA